MPFSSGQYMITSAGTDKHVGCHPNEGDEFGPKDIYSDDFCDAMWELEAQSNDEYILKQRGTPVAPFQDHLAVFQTHDEPCKWQIRDTGEDDVYEIVKCGSNRGWVQQGNKVNVTEMTGTPADRFYIYKAGY
ncbi:hypothetical protein TWF696_009648 [Orbilia brochopaga]|uniref:Uncharacterized protein n=1 Tax=Orbilia brochopaga TaxID=3140254 RepID=A0AAV9UB61_9PEZI